MKTQSATRRTSTWALGAFGACVLVGVLVLLSHTQLSVPFLAPGSLYHVSITVKDADNLVSGGQVRVAGVAVGNVLGVREEADGAVATLGIDEKYAPLHEGAIIHIGNRSLVEETYVGIQDGTGKAIPDGALLPADTVRGSTQIRDILHSLDPATRESLAASLRSFGAATAGTQEPVNQLFSGLGGVGGVGGDGDTALEAIASQGEDLRRLTVHTTTMLKALDTGQGQIATMVDDANRLTRVTQERRAAVEGTMERLPHVLDSARGASDSLRGLAAALGPVAGGLRESGPQLSDAMHHLPEITRDFRGLLPDLQTSLDRAPDTLGRVDTFSHDLRDDLIPHTREILQDANPILGYLKNYGPEVGGFISNFGAMMGYTDEAGRSSYHVMVTGTDSAPSAPVNTGNVGRLNYYNPLPAPGKLLDPGPFKGGFPRLERESK